MEQWKKDSRREALITDIDTLVPKEHLLRKIERVMDYDWLYELLSPHFATVSYAFCKRFPSDVTEEIFEHILNKTINQRMVEPSAAFIDRTHIKASANKKSSKRSRKKAAKVYDEQLLREVNAERERLGKAPHSRTVTAKMTAVMAGIQQKNSVHDRPRLRIIRQG